MLHKQTKQPHQCHFKPSPADREMLPTTVVDDHGPDQPYPLVPAATIARRSFSCSLASAKEPAETWPHPRLLSTTPTVALPYYTLCTIYYYVETVPNLQAVGNGKNQNSQLVEAPQYGVRYLCIYPLQAPPSHYLLLPCSLSFLLAGSALSDHQAANLADWLTVDMLSSSNMQEIFLPTFSEERREEVCACTCRFLKYRQVMILPGTQATLCRRKKTTYKSTGIFFFLPDFRPVVPVSVDAPQGSQRPC